VAHFLQGADHGVRKSQTLTVWGGAAQHGAVLIPNYVVGCHLSDSAFRIYCRLCCVPHGRVISIDDLCSANQIAPKIASCLDILCDKGLLQPVYDIEAGEYPIGINIPSIRDVVFELSPETGSTKTLASKIRKAVDVKKITLYADFRPDNVTVEAWDDWISYRKKRRLTLSDLSLKRQAGFLLKHGELGDEIIYQSIRNGWTGLFEFKGSRRVQQEGRILREQHEQLFEDVL